MAVGDLVVGLNHWMEGGPFASDPLDAGFFGMSAGSQSAQSASLTLGQQNDLRDCSRLGEQQGRQGWREWNRAAQQVPASDRQMADALANMTFKPPVAKPPTLIHKAIFKGLEDQEKQKSAKGSDREGQLRANKDQFLTITARAMSGEACCYVDRHPFPPATGYSFGDGYISGIFSDLEFNCLPHKHQVEIRRYLDARNKTPVSQEEITECAEFVQKELRARALSIKAPDGYEWVKKPSKPSRLWRWTKTSVWFLVRLPVLIPRVAFDYFRQWTGFGCRRSLKGAMEAKC